MYSKNDSGVSYVIYFLNRRKCLSLRKHSWLFYIYTSILLILLSQTRVSALELSVSASNDTFWTGVTPPPSFGVSKPGNSSRFNATDVLPTIANPEYLEEIYADNHGMALECRHDVCVPESIEDYTGQYQWNYTLAGEYAFLPCPNGDWFDGTTPVYAYRPCNPPRQQKLLRNNFLSEDARWGEPTTKYCRFTSNITNELDEIRQQLLDAIRDMLEDEYSNLTRIAEPLSRANEILRENTHRLTPPDIEYAASILDILIAATADGVVRLVADVGQGVVNMVNHLLEVDFEVLEKAGHACLSIAKNLQAFVGYADLGGEDLSIHFTGDGVVVDIQQETTGDFEGSLDLEFHSPTKGDAEGKTVAKIHVPRFGDFLQNFPAIRDVNATNPSQRPDTVNQKSPDRDTKAVPKSQIRVGTIVYFTNKFFRIKTISRFLPSGQDVIVYLQVYKDRQIVPISDESELYITYYHSTSHIHDATNETSWFGENCAVGQLGRNESLQWRSPYRPVDLDWYPDSCKLNYTNENFTTCLCVGLELLALIADRLPTPEPTTLPPPPDPLAFFSFPYSLTLSIVSYVGYAFSLVSLVLTILTYALFPRLRRGRQTYILLNMCLTLLMFVVFLLSSIAFCDTTMGCRIANIIRVYLILVSLMWNGVEGVHMYLTMVKVFVAHTSHFVVKCGIVAWGLPATIIAIPLIVDVSVFDGSIVNCSFACQLSHTAFYFIFLLPMLVIVIFNSVVFGFVIRILYKIQVNDRSKKSNMLSRVRGAIAVLVLLGITWGFSAAAAINYHYYFEVPQVASYILQTFFVFGIAFQGFFIFVFHCVRYKDVRKQWRKTLSPKKPLFSRWRTLRRKSADSPIQTQISPQLTREDLLNPSPPQTAPSSQCNDMISDSSHGSEGEQVEIGLINLGQVNSVTRDSYL